MYTYHYKPTRYYKRHRTYAMQDGGEMRVLTTRYTYQMFYKPAKGPRGGRGRKECARSVYYAGGMFWIACNLRDADGEYYNSLKPFSGHMWDVHSAQSEQQGVPVVSIWCEDGRPYAIEMDGERMDIAPGEWPEMYALVLDLPEPEQPEQPEAVKPEPEQQPSEADRVAWIESTTAEGQQLDLVAWAGYGGDATWQELARPAA